MVLPKPRAGRYRALHHLQEELGVRDAERVVPGLFLVDVGGERAAHVDRRPLPEHAREKDRKISHVGHEFVAKVNGELLRVSPGG